MITGKRLLHVIGVALKFDSGLKMANKKMKISNKIK